MSSRFARALGGVGLCSLVCMLSVTLHAQQGKVEQELMQLERDWCAADVKNDAAVFQRILSDDYTGVSSQSGKLTGKADYLAQLKTSKTTQCDVDMMRVRIYGDTAVVTGRTTVKSNSFSGQSMWTDTWVRRNGAWQCVASQGTVIKP